MRQLLRVDEVARALGIPRLRVYALARSGELPCLKFGKRSVRFDPVAIEKWIEQQGASQVSRRVGLDAREGC